MSRITAYVLAALLLYAVASVGADSAAGDARDTSALQLIGHVGAARLAVNGGR